MEAESSPFAPRQMAVQWQQHSAERRACYYQAYGQARHALDRALAAEAADRPRAVILDIDETVLDNSPFFARLLEPGVVVSEQFLMNEFERWMASGQAKAQPGAVAFLRYAKSRGVEPFYVSNRPTSMLQATIDDLASEGCPNADPEHVLLQPGPLNFFGEKAGQWRQVAADYDVLLYIGDNLGDMGGAFKDRGDDHGHASVDEQSGAFGTRFILMPNPMYGPWERSLERGE